MATPPDAGEPSPSGISANTHFFRPNDGIYVSEGAEQRTICISPHLPPAMARSGDWHVEQFELHKELYRGKTSLLYMATDRVSGVQCALKLYRKRKLSVLNRYQVEREVRLHINLHHENIIHLFAAFEDEKHVYMVQEFAVCGDLFEDLKKGGGQLKEKYAVRDVIVPFLSALAYLHAQGIIHRDIKPENILLGANKTIKVADFGLSINIHHERPVTRAGTLDYMAPEVLVCPDKRRPEENKDKVLLGYTAQVDSWAVGILAYELLVGYPPFEQESRAATYEHIMYKEPKYPSWMTEDAKKFIGLALCKNATQRPTVADLMAHLWVQPYIMRHTVSTTTSATPGPSRLRNSVSMAHHERSDPGRNSSSATGMAPSAPAGATSLSTSGATPTSGSGVRMVMQLPTHPPAQRSSSHVMADPSSGGMSPKYPGSASPAASHRTPQPQAHGAASLNTSSSLKVSSPVLQDPITGMESRLHDSISDPTIRSFEGQHGLQQPHAPGATAAASLLAASRSGGGSDVERANSGMASSTSFSGGGTRAAAHLGGPSGNLSSRLGPSGHSIPRPTPPPLTLESGEASSDMSCGGEAMPMSPSGGALSSGHARGAAGGMTGVRPPGAGVTPPGPGTPPPRHRMAPPGINTNLSGGNGGGGSSAGGRMPAPPVSPKPLTPEMVTGYHRPASGVLSDDSFLPPARSPSMSLGGQHLSPLQAALLAPRPSSRLNSPSHSRRNSISQAGNAPCSGASGGPNLQLHTGVSTPLPQLSGDYGDGMGGMGLYTDDHSARTSSSHKYVGGVGGGAGAAGSAGGGVGAAGGGKMFGKLWGGNGGTSGTESPMDTPSSSGPSFSSRGGTGGANASPMARSAAAARVRMMTPEDLRPLMRESSINSMPKSSGGLRDELSQPSMTLYHRPGKVPGVGRAAVAAREQEAAEAAAGSGMGIGRDGGISKTKSLVNRNLHGVVGDDGGAGAPLVRMGSDAALARTAAGQAAASGAPSVASQRSFTSANSAFARKLANGAIATKVTEYVKGRMPHDEEMED